MGKESKELKRYRLRPGTVLDGRYETGSVLGEGGFGITYEGTNLHNGEKVAIKEFFCRDYMDRDRTLGNDVILTGDTAEKRFRTERGRFMREGRIVGEFKHEPGVVEVLDYFEENETAYIVMEYLDGVPLNRYVHENGPFSPEQLFEEIRPVLNSLGKIHEAGVVHRDISPDNIIRMDDGSMVLIDFGSARKLGGGTRTTTSTYKDGYAPPEQYNTDRDVTPATDIYSLCATFYYCLTGIKPESSIQRVLLDELRTPKALGCRIPDSVADMIDRGMSLRMNERQGSVSQLLSVLDEEYPVLTPEQKAKKKERKRLRKILAACAAAAAVIGVIAVFVTNSTEYRLRMQDTQKIYVNFDGMEYGEKSGWDETMRGRLEAFAGRNNFRWEEGSSDDVMMMEFPSSLLCGRNPDEICGRYLTCTTDDLTLRNLDEGETMGSKGFGFRREDIESVVTGEGVIPTGSETEAEIPHLQITLKEEAAAKAESYLSAKGTNLALSLGDGNGSAWVPCYSGGDGTVFYAVLPESVDEDDLADAQHASAINDNTRVIKVDKKAGETFREALRYDLENDSPGRSPGFYSEPVVRWEDPDNNILAGGMQVSLEELTGEKLMLVYAPEEAARPDRTAWVNTVLAVKDRLDELKIPYAFGTPAGDDRKFVIMTGREDLGDAEAAMLGCDAKIFITDTVHQKECTPDEAKAFGISGEAGDPGRLAEVYCSDGGLDAARDVAGKAEAGGQDKIFICLGPDLRHPVAYAETEEFAKGLKKGKIALTHLCSADLSDITCDRHAAYINKLLTSKTGCSMYLAASYLYDEDNGFEGVRTIAVTTD